jgi:hypothetical protein
MDRIYRAQQGMGGRYVVERDDTYYWMGGDLFGDYWPGKEIGKDEPLVWTAPVRPSIVVAIGLNYKDHAAEMNKKLPAEPLVFLKPSTTVIGPEEPIRLPAWAGRIEHEAEMAVVIGRTAARGREADGARKDRPAVRCRASTRPSRRSTSSCRTHRLPRFRHGRPGRAGRRRRRNRAMDESKGGRCSPSRRTSPFSAGRSPRPTPRRS